MTSFIWIFHLCVVFVLAGDNSWKKNMEKGEMPSRFKNMARKTVSMMDYCATHNITKKSDSKNPIICPKFVEKIHKYVCLNDTLPDFRTISGVKYAQYLRAHNITMWYVGDSLTQEMFYAIECSCEAENIPSSAVVDGVLLAHWDQLLAPLPQNFNHTRIGRSDVHWFKDAMIKKPTYIVLNTGAWWNPGTLRMRDSDGNWTTPSERDVAICFEEHFAPHGELFRMLKTLKENGVTAIWRELGPSGSCITSSTIYRYRTTMFPIFNYIGSTAVKAVGGLVAGRIWDDTLPHWAHHISERDDLHYCAFNKYSVPMLWNEHLYKLLLEKHGP